MKSSAIILLFVCIQLCAVKRGCAQISEPIPLTEDQQLLGLGRQHLLRSEILDEERPIIISTPVGYETSDATYPVLYLLDGLGNIKHVVATAESLAESGTVPPMIIVGIQSLDRARDLPPSAAGEAAYGSAGDDGIPQSGGAPVFLDFVANELMPYVESNYRTHPYRILEGHSFGGLFGTYALMNRPGLFDAFIIQSPALWWNQEEMTQQAKTFFAGHEPLDKSIYLGIGGGDGWGMKQELKRYVQVIDEADPKGLRWKHEEVGNEDHDEARLILNYYGLKFIFADLKSITTEAEQFDAQAFLDAENELLSAYGPLARRPAASYIHLYSVLTGLNQPEEALVVLKRACEAYPKYVGLLNILAQLYEKVDRDQDAIRTYALAIEVSQKYKLGYEDGFEQEMVRLQNKTP